MAVRALEYLMQLYPDKTAKEILAIQKQDELDEKKAEDKRNARKIAFMNDINTNGGYYRGRFGLDQHYYWKVSNMSMDNRGEIWMDCESITLFCNPEGHKNIVTRPGEMSLERKTKEYVQLDRFSLDNEERITVKEWDALNAYIDAMSSLFWKSKP